MYALMYKHNTYFAGARRGSGCQVNISLERTNLKKWTKECDMGYGSLGHVEEQKELTTSVLISGGCINYCSN